MISEAEDRSARETPKRVQPISDADTYRQAGRPTKTESMRLARALIRAAKADLCPCGVRPRHCAEHRTTTEEAP